MKDKFQEFFAQFNILEDKPKIAVAVSGGADSLLMTLLVNEYVRERNGELHAITVDHRIRCESRDEAMIVGRWMSNRGINHHIIELDLKLNNNILKEARDERYSSLFEWCRDNNIYDLCIGHNIDDQAENFMIRSIRGSGTEGLSSMKNILYSSNVRVIRPIMNLSKQQIKSELEFHKQDWIDDPSNLDEKFLRIRVRNFINSQNFLDSELFKRRLVDNSRKLLMAQQVIDNCIFDFISTNVKIINKKKIVNLVVSLEKFLFLERYLALKFLQKFLTILGDKEYSPRFRGTEKLYMFLSNEISSGTMVINKCRVILLRKENLFLMESSAKKI